MTRRDPLFPPRQRVEQVKPHDNVLGSGDTIVIVGGAGAVGGLGASLLGVLVAALAENMNGPASLIVSAVVTLGVLSGLTYGIHVLRRILNAAHITKRGMELVKRIDALIERARAAYLRAPGHSAVRDLVTELHGARDEIITAAVGLREDERVPAPNQRSLTKRYDALTQQVAALSEATSELERFVSSNDLLNDAQRRGRDAEALLIERSSRINHTATALSQARQINQQAHQELLKHVEGALSADPVLDDAPALARDVLAHDVLATPVRHPAAN